MSSGSFVIKHGFQSKNDSIITGSLKLYKSGSTVFEIQGSQGQLFSIDDNLIGDFYVISDISGIPILTINSDKRVTISGTLKTVGESLFTGSVQGEVNSLVVASNTASLDLNNGTFFTLQLISGSNVRIEPANIKPGLTISLKINTTGSGTVSFPSTVKQPSGSLYVPTTGSGVDIMTFISFDSSSLYTAYVKTLI